jgi:hypothetical protein
MPKPPKPKPWDGSEPVTDALERFGLANNFYSAIDGGNGDAARQLLRDVGVDPESAERIVAGVLKGEGREPQR